MIEQIKKILGVDTDADLARRLGCDRAQIVRWRKNGFKGSTGELIKILVRKKNGENESRHWIK